jgi:cyclase
MDAPRSDHYEFESIGERIWAAIATATGHSICNSGVVDLGAGVLVFDTGMTPGSAQDLRTAGDQLFGRMPSLVANSHWHADHTFGNRAFGGVPIWSTRRTREIILQNAPQMTAELTRERQESDLRELEAKRSKMRTKAQKSDFEIWIQIQRALLAAIDEVKIVPPSQTFETRMELPGERGAELVSFGAGHTEADAVLFFPREKLLFAGDLLTYGVQPSMGSGDPEHWLTVVDELERLRPERIVPGHGPVIPPEGMQATRDYLSGVLKAAESPKSAPLPAAIRKWEGSLGLEWNLKFARDRVKARKAKAKS